MKMAKKDWLWLIAVFFVWRLLLIVVSFSASNFLPMEPMLGDKFTSYSLGILPENAGFRRWWNFDGIHYLTIVTESYVGTGGIQAFFPLWPILIEGAAKITTLPPWVAGYIVNVILSFAVLVLLYKYVLFLADKKPMTKSLARRSILALLVFPTSFYLTAGYNESLFLVLLLAALFLYQKRKFVGLSLVLMLLCATRIVGIVAVMAFFLAELWRIFSTKKFATKTSAKILPLVLIALGALGLVAYMIFLHNIIGDALAFWHVQSAFGAGRSTGIVLLPQVIWRYIKMVAGLAASGQLISWRGLSLAQELLISLIFLGILIWQAWQFLRQHLHFLRQKFPAAAEQNSQFFPLELILFSGGAFLLPTLTGNFSSMPRYVLVCLSVFFAFAKLKNKFLVTLLFTFCLLLLILNTTLFLQAYWVA